jgi:hypothetical protein
MGGLCKCRGARGAASQNWVFVLTLYFYVMILAEGQRIIDHTGLGELQALHVSASCPQRRDISKMPTYVELILNFCYNGY